MGMAIYRGTNDKSQVAMIVGCVRHLRISHNDKQDGDEDCFFSGFY